ncbi:replication restart helicase PriA [Aggregatilinea lenta]|uniref:replication restart helicase PriA n=1 Tax=Aggregatilinea lenta TaxID=913108 RepID=UPI0013C2BBFE|nr:primosomal protein N' [Aggregatilinea lenta]
MFAEVAVNRRVSGTFSYHIPPELAGKIAPGHLVKVAFGTAHTTGIVVSLADSVDIPETKPILERVDPLPVVTPAQIALARWLSEETLTPLGACLWLMLPPGLAKRGDLLYTLIKEDTEAHSSVQERILSLLKRRGPLRGRQLTHSLPQTRWQSSMSGLVKRGVIEQEPVLDSPDVKPKFVRTVQLAIPAARVADVAPRLGRESRRANILEALLTARDHRMQLSALCRAVGCTEAPVKALAQEHEVAIDSKQTWIELAVPNDEIASRLANGDYAQAPAQKEALEILLEAGGSVPIEILNKYAVKPLEDVTTIRRVVEPAWVELAIDPDVALRRIIELRGSQPYLDVLNALAHETEPVNVSEIYASTGTTLARLQRLADDGLVMLGEAESWRDPLVDQEFVPVLAPPLTEEQALAWHTIQRYMDTVHWGKISPRAETSGVFLLHGVTGSGKTEIYLRAVEHVLAQGRQAIVLVPEISLTPQTIRRFAARFPGRVSVVHSGLSAGERYDTWRRARAGDLHVIVGARSALFTPLPDVGLVILDEEHDDSYKSSPPITPPFYHARDTAIKMMQITHGTVLLGSATPDVVTYYRATRRQYTLLHLPDRVIAHRERLAEQTRRLNAPVARYQPTSASDAMSAALPGVRVVDMRQELRAGNRSIFSRPLHTAINEVVSRHEQAILFLNRRGTATFVMCRNCGYIASCPRCNTPLTYHGPQQALVCHYCGYTRDHITVCPECHSTKIKHFGQGTELIETAVQTAFPHARTIRWDRDTATGRDAHELILKSFSERHADILIGTQMVAKGLDLPHVTLVGIISADTALGLPDYRAGERTFQLLTQVAGRAGRGALGGRVILQSYLPEHYAIRAAAGHDYDTFFKQEIEFRREQMYPPFRRLARLVFQYDSPQRAEKEARYAAQVLQNHITGMQFTATELIGPTPCFFAKRNNLYRWHLVLRSPDPADVLRGIDRADEWIIDIDPVDML